ncbi:MAG: type II toxin-antitoxin system RelE/ParE family toxin, partial [Verrucomicrobiales bacterium]|nr:type II toxin-antitoxin system RelE/ParE family toxin [Verrucomicrobiales bacterium]
REAEQEMIGAAPYYESQGAGRGSDFLDEVEAAINAIEVNPFRYGYYDRSVRSIRLARFPYWLLFVAEEDRIVIIAVMHLHRRPGCWKRRLN